MKCVCKIMSSAWALSQCGSVSPPALADAHSHAVLWRDGYHGTRALALAVRQRSEVVALQQQAQNGAHLEQREVLPQTVAHAVNERHEAEVGDRLASREALRVEPEGVGPHSRVVVARLKPQYDGRAARYGVAAQHVVLYARSRDDWYHRVQPQ